MPKVCQLVFIFNLSVTDGPPLRLLHHHLAAAGSMKWTRSEAALRAVS